MKSFQQCALSIATTLLFIWVTSPALAEQSLAPLQPPDPKGIVLSDLNFAPTPKDVRDYDTYFYFYKSGVSYQTAFEDIDQCRIYSLTTQIAAIPPRFVPLGSNDLITAARPHNGSRLVTTVPGGVVGAGVGSVVGSLFLSVIVRQAQEEQAIKTNNRCMAYKGYSRYGTSHAIWNSINAGEDADNIARMALIASGPLPPAKAIDP